MKIPLLAVDLPFLNEYPYLAIVLRALSVYIFMIVAIRVFGKKELAQLSVIDLVFILLISNAVQNAMVGPDTSLLGGIIAAGALFAANFTLKNILYRHEGLNRLLQGESVVLVYKGQVEIAHCRKAEITIEELEAAAREHGVADLQHVDLAMLEIDGNISIISHDFQKKTKMEHPKKKRLRGRVLRN